MRQYVETCQCNLQYKHTLTRLSKSISQQVKVLGSRFKFFSYIRTEFY